MDLEASGPYATRKVMRALDAEHEVERFAEV
jgi:hypothetical protein